MNNASLRWDKPGPGTWALDRAHSAGPVSPVMQAIAPAAMADGFLSFTERYGLVISHMEVCYVNGLPYGAMRIAGLPASDRPPPPAAVLKVLTRLHPVMRRRDRRARRALAERTWHDDLVRWFDELRPAKIAAARNVQVVDPAALEAAELASHVEDCAAVLAGGLRTHYSLIGAASVPVGLHLLEQAERGRGTAAALTDLTGAAADSTAAPSTALASIADALAAADVTARDLDDVRGASPAAAAALDAYLEEFGQRVVDAFDVTGRRLVELPDLVLRSISAAEGRTGAPAPATDEEVFDEVLADARLALASRDDHAGICCMWPLGLVRRALLAAGEVLHDRGRVDDPRHILDASLPEVRALFECAPDAPAAVELAERAATRRRVAAVVAPDVLGEATAPPDPAVFPAGLRRTSAALGAFLATMGAGPAPDRDRRVGVGVGEHVFRGRAVVATHPEDAIERVRSGDVLVTSTTTPAFNCVLPVVGALVTAHGGAMSHAGIAARELGFSAVVGLTDALERIPDGIEVEVDPVAGTVEPAPSYVAFGPGLTLPHMAPERIGGKAASLVGMTRLGLPVPPGFVLPARPEGAGERLPAADEAELRAALADLEDRAGRRLGNPDRPLLVSVRSGAAVSMPGMLDTVLDVGATPDVVAGLARSTGDACFADDTHRRFLTGWASIVGAMPENVVAEAAEAATSPADLARRLAGAGSRPPADPIEQVIEAVAAVRRSWDGERARAFRRAEGIDDAAGTAVTVQMMVFGNLGPDSATGVVFSRDPSTGAPGLVGDVLVGAQGDDVVGGAHRTLTLDEWGRRRPDVHAELARAVSVLEHHHVDMVDVEFTVERGRLNLLQARPGRRSAAAAFRLAVDMAEDPSFPLDRAGAVARCRHLLAAPAGDVVALADDVVAAHLVVAGQGASPGRGAGALAVSVDDALRRHDAGQAVVLVRPTTSPADVTAMAVAAGVVTATGGLVSHAALVARSWGLPAVVGATGLEVDANGIVVGGRRIDAGEIVTVDGTAGLLLTGDHPAVTTDPPALAILRGWAAASETGTRSSGRVDLAVDTDVGPRRVDGRSNGDLDLDILRLAVVRGRVEIGTTANVLGVEDGPVTEAVGRLVAEDALTGNDGVATPTAAGRARVDADRQADRDRHAAAFVDLLDRFSGPDRALKELVTDHQLATTPSGEEDSLTLADRLRGGAHADVAPVIADAARTLPRLARYGERLETALARLAGDDRYLAHPSVDSYHSIWFELHEELIGLAGTSREVVSDDGPA